MVTKTKTEQLTLCLSVLFIIIITLLPFHAFFSTWIISNIGHPDLIKSWKEILLFGVMLPIAVILLINNKTARKTIVSRKINWLVVAFLLLNIFFFMVVRQDFRQSVAGLLFNVRFFTIFLVAQVIGEVATIDLIKLAVKVVFAGGLIVVIFGVFQVMFLPTDWLRHFGYASSTIPPYLIVDNDTNIVRILSTLRGPNILGEYLIMWMPLLVLFSSKRWSRNLRNKLFIIFVWLCSFVTLFGTRSRGAFLGVIVSLIFSLFFLVKNKKLFYAVISLVLLLGTTLMVINIRSDIVQNLVLHDSTQNSNPVNSNDQHVSSLKSAVSQIYHSPFGAGVGSAGLASTYGNKPNIVENYYLHISVELGILGGLLFILIISLMIAYLYGDLKNPLIVVLFSGFIGLALINVFMPGWSDETVSMIWWGLAGLLVFNSQLKDREAIEQNNSIFI